jgi:4-hydroxy-tetrahydrodipicolinate synthase
MHERLTGASLITAIKTPFLPDGRIDFDAFDRLAERQAAAGVDGLVVTGTTGEGHLMHWDEQIALIAHAAQCFGDRMLIIGNTGSNYTTEAVHATELGFRVGMHAALQINPYYGKTSAAGLEEHFRRVLEFGPGIVYNVPGRTGQDLLPDVLERIAQHPNFVAVKECCGPERMAELGRRGIRCWSGNDDDCLGAWADGHALGVISVLSNVVPGLMRRLLDARTREPPPACRDLVAWLFSQPNPIPVNTALAMMGLVRPAFRLPYVPMSRAERERGVAILRQVGLAELGVATVEPLADADFSVN